MFMGWLNRVIVACWVASLCGVAGAQQEIVTLPTRPGVTQSYFLTSAPKQLQAIAILFPGSGGLIQLRNEGGQPRFAAGNFLVRSRAEFVRRGVIAAIVDAPSDQQGGWGMTDEFRLGADHAVDIGAVVDDLRKRMPNIPIYLIGTSRGTISAAALAARGKSPNFTKRTGAVRSGDFGSQIVPERGLGSK